MKSNEDKTYNQRQKLTHDFLHEYLLQKRLENILEDNLELANMPDYLADYDAAQRDMPPLAPARRPDVEELLPGQIRLLAQPASRVQVLLVYKWGSDCWLVVPFSPYAFPATDEEWRLGGGRAMNLDVLQIWNARSLNALFLRQSWLVDVLSDQEKQLVEEALSCSLAAEEMPAEILAETGLPIIATHDPRLDYKEEQLARFNELDAADFQWSEQAAEAAAKAVCDLALDEITMTNQDASVQPSLPLVAEENAMVRRKVFSPLPMAASGRSSASQCWHYPGSANLLLQSLLHPDSVESIPALTAEMVAWCGHQEFPTAGDGQKPWLWDWSGQLSNHAVCKDALFFHRRKKVLLGTGYALLENQEGTIVLSDWVSETTPLLESPAEITIFLMEPENFGYE